LKGGRRFPLSRGLGVLRGKKGKPPFTAKHTKKTPSTPRARYKKRTPDFQKREVQAFERVKFQLSTDTLIPDT
jgi:hypothetical protein